MTKYRLVIYDGHPLLVKDSYDANNNLYNSHVINGEWDFVYDPATHTIHTGISSFAISSLWEMVIDDELLRALEADGIKIYQWQLVIEYLLEWCMDKLIPIYPAGSN